MKHGKTLGLQIRSHETIIMILTVVVQKKRENKKRKRKKKKASNREQFESIEEEVFENF